MPVLVAQGAVRRRYRSWFSRGLTWLGMLIFIVLAFVGPGWTLLAVTVIAMTIRIAMRTSSSRWELDAPGPDARLRFGPRAASSVRLTDLSAVVVIPFPGASSRGIPITRAHVQWWLVDHAGAAIGGASTEGLDPGDVERFRLALPVPFVTLRAARDADAVPRGIPWYQVHTGRALLVAIALTCAVMLTVVLLPTYWG